MNKSYSPFAVKAGSSDIAHRAAAAADCLNLVRDAGYQLTAMMADNEVMAALSSLVGVGPTVVS